MSKIQTLIDKIEQQYIGATNRRVLIAEGVDYQNTITAFLNKKFPQWDSEWVVIAAGKKTHVIDVLNEKPDWWIDQNTENSV